jgi:hypothetical protein
MCDAATGGTATPQTFTTLLSNSPANIPFSHAVVENPHPSPFFKIPRASISRRKVR